MCKREIINAGIKEVVIRKTKTEYEIIQVQEFVKNDEKENKTVQKRKETKKV